MTQNLTKPEQCVRDTFISNLKIQKRKTTRPIVVGMIGLAGSGKSLVARELAPMMGATIIEHDRIRIGLRAAHLPYDHMAIIAADATQEVIWRGGNVIFDTDSIGREKREIIVKIAREAAASVFFIRVTCDLDIMLGRILTKLDKKPDLFFQDASLSRKGSVRQKAGVIKMREMIRRMQHHYCWNERNGGTWILKKLSPRPFAEIDTGSPKWKHKVKRIAQQIQRDSADFKD